MTFVISWTIDGLHWRSTGASWRSLLLTTANRCRSRTTKSVTARATARWRSMWPSTIFSGGVALRVCRSASDCAKPMVFSLRPTVRCSVSRDRARCAHLLLAAPSLGIHGRVGINAVALREKSSLWGGLRSWQRTAAAPNDQFPVGCEEELDVANACNRYQEQVGGSGFSASPLHLPPGIGGRNNLGALRLEVTRCCGFQQSVGL